MHTLTKAYSLLHQTHLFTCSPTLCCVHKLKKLFTTWWVQLLILLDICSVWAIADTHSSKEFILYIFKWAAKVNNNKYTNMNIGVLHSKAKHHQSPFYYSPCYKILRIQTHAYVTLHKKLSQAHTVQSKRTVPK